MPAKKRSTKKVSKNPKLRRVNLLSSSINRPAKKKTSWPGFSPTISLVLIVIVALIVGGGLWYLSTMTKSTNSNTSISITTNRNNNSNGNGNINSNAGTVTTPDGNVSLACTADIDCGFIDSTRTYSVCCATPSCLPDYSAEQYVAVNQQSHNNIVQTAVGQLDCATPCPSYVMEECVAVQQTVRAACVNGVCRKIARSEQGSNTNANSNTNTVSSKTCQTNNDCGLQLCGGCFSNDYLVNAVADLPCARYEGYTCQCINSQCTEFNPTTVSWTTYANSELGLSFKYPPEFGTVVFSWQPSESGKEFNGTLDHNSRLIFSGMTDDFSAGRGGGILDTRGFIEQNGKYYFTFVADKPTLGYPVEPIKILTGASNQKILLLDQNSFVNDRGITDGPTFAVSLGTNALAGLMNTGNATYPGLVIVNKDLTTFSQTQFEDLLETVVLTE